MTRGYEPLLIVAYIGDRPVGKLLAVIRKSVRLFPPSIIKRCEIYGTGEYFDEEQNKEDLFGEMLEHLTKRSFAQIVSHRVPQPGKSAVRIQSIQKEQLFRHQLAKGTQFTAQ